MANRRDNQSGSIFQDKDGYWWAQLDKGEDGKRPRRRRKTKKEAQEALKEMMRDRGAGVSLTIRQPTVAEWYRTWLETFAIDLRPHITAGYMSLLRCYIADRPIGTRRLDRLTSVEVQRWVNELSTVNALAPRTVRNAHARLRTALGVAVQHGYVARNVAIGIKLPKRSSAEQAKIETFTFQQVIQLLDYLKGHRWYALYRLAVNLGPRFAEITGLTWDRIDLKKGELHIGQQLQRIPDPNKQNAYIFDLLITKTKSGNRTIILDDDLIAVLRKHRANQAEEQLISTEWKDPYHARGGLVFTSGTGAPIYHGLVATHFRSVLRKAGLPTIRFHDLRHTAATLMLADGVPLVTVSKILGHSSPAVTATIYAHALDESKASAVAGLSKRLREG